MEINELKKKTVLVLGAGKTGISSAIFLLNKAKKVLLSESQGKSKDYNEKINQLISNGVETEFNKNSDDFIKRAELVIISPGISPYSEVVKKINGFGIPIISDIELASYFINKPIIGVTGTNGKTTTSSLITHLIDISSKKALICGNIGKPLISIFEESNNDIDYYVVEISSFQIFYSPTLSCDIAVCLNITPDHLDWHGNFNHYLESKKKLFLQQKKNSWSILNFSDSTIKNFKTKNNIFYFSTDESNITSLKDFSHFAFYENNFLKIKEKEEISSIINKKELKIIGLHNIENALASIAVAKIININDDKIKEGLKSFEGVEHRLEFVRFANGKIFYNDSKATNPEATIKAISALSEKESGNITLILGGKDKNTNLNQMIEAIKSNINEVILFGEAKDRFKKELTNSNYKRLKVVMDLNEAVITSLKSEGKTVLFSPACSSFDMFKNYEERGKYFKELVSKL